MQRHITGGGRRRGVAADVGQVDPGLVGGQRAAHVMLAGIPGALIHGLFLAPDGVAHLGVSAENPRQFRFGEGVELFEAENGDVVDAPLAARGAQIVEHFAGTENHALHRGFVDIVGFIQHVVEAPVGEFFQRGGGLFMAQQTLGRHDHQGFAQGPDRLAPQHVKHLGRRARHADLNIVLGAELQKALETRRAVLRALALVAVGQQHGQATQARPFVLTAGDELVDDDLGAIGKIAELRFPNDQAGRRGGRIAVFKGQHRFLGQQGVVDQKAGLVIAHVLQGDQAVVVALVMQHRVAVRERAAAHILPGEAHRIPLFQQTRVGQGLGKAPVEGHGPGRHLAPILEDLRYLARQGEVVRGHIRIVGQGLQVLQIDAGRAGQRPLVTQIGRPVHEHARIGFGYQTRYQRLVAIQRLAVFLDQLSIFLFADHAGLDKTARVDIARAGVLANGPIHGRLGYRGLVRFVVPAAAIADQVHHRVALEFIAVIDRQLGDEQHRLRVVGVDVKNRRLHHFCHVRAVLRGAGIFAATGGESDLIIHHDMQRAARFIGPGLRHLKGLHDHALPGKGRVAVNDHGPHAVAHGIAAPLLARAHRALHHRRYDFQVRGIEDQGQMHLAARGHHVGGEALVVLHVTRTLVGRAALELGEQLRGHFAQDVHQHVQTTAVRHADNDFLGAVAPDALNHLGEHRDQALAAFEAEAFRSRELRAQRLFQAVGLDQAAQNLAAHIRAVIGRRAHGLHARHNPLALLRVHDVHELDAHRMAVGLLQGVDNIVQGRRVVADFQTADLKSGVEIGG